MSGLRAAVIGAGHLGRHHARIYSEMDAVRLVGVADVLPERAREIAGRYGAESVEDYRSLAGRIDVASVAVPTILHAEIAGSLLESGIDVLVEKPFTTTIEEADSLIEAARRNGRTLMVGHTERFNPAVSALAGLVRDARFVEAQRLGSFSARSTDIDVVLDLMIHDIDILLSLSGGNVVSVDAVGVGALTDMVDIASARVRLDTGCVANLTASRISDEKIRKLRVFESAAYYSLDYADRTVDQCRLVMRSEDSEARPEIQRGTVPVDPGEPLAREIAVFVEAARVRGVAEVSGEDGREALRVALLVLRSIRERAPVVVA